MPPYIHSRYLGSLGLKDKEGRLFLTEREPFRFRAFEDTRRHIVAEGDTLFNLAGRYFAPLDRPAGFWWVIADFQPQPIIDPTLKLELGRTIYVPSVRVVEEYILGGYQ